MPFDKEKAKENLRDILDRMQNNTDAVLLHEYYKLYKKEVSVFRRSFAAAWLFMHYDEITEKPNRPKSAAQSAAHSAASKVKLPFSKFQKAERKTDEENTEKQSVVVSIPEEESKKLFISIGKNRRLFPREIITMIMTKTSAAREDIGIIRILDNYSFVQVRDTKAAEIIDALTGFRFRGRTLNVNYAKPKTSENETEN